VPCGSHTATGVPSGDVSLTLTSHSAANVSPVEPSGADPTIARLIAYSTPSNVNCDGIDVINIPRKDPAAAAYDHFEPAADLIACLDTSVILNDVLRAACAGGQGFAARQREDAPGGRQVGRSGRPSRLRSACERVTPGP
jgi:hypothetical protein